MTQWLPSAVLWTLHLGMETQEGQALLRVRAQEEQVGALAAVVRPWGPWLGRTAGLGHGAASGPGGYSVWPAGRVGTDC